MNSWVNGGSGKPPSVLQVLRSLLFRPIETIVRRWNWKSAYLSSLIRALSTDWMTSGMMNWSGDGNYSVGNDDTLHSSMRSPRLTGQICR